MADIRSRLADCFAAVFPALPAAEVQRASLESTESWTSLATATLMALVEEEFRIQVDPEDLNQFVSFDEILKYVQSKAAGA